MSNLCSRDLFLAKGANHTVGKDQSFDLRRGSDLTNDGGWHVQGAGNLAAIFRDSMMRDEYVCLLCQTRQRLIVIVHIATKYQAMTIDIDPPGQAGYWPMMYRHRSDTVLFV